MRQHDGIELAPAQSRRDLFRIACGVHREGGGAVRHNVDVGLIRPQNQERRVDARSLHLICHVVLLNQYLRASGSSGIAPRPRNGNEPHRSAHPLYPTKPTRESGPPPGGFRSQPSRIQSNGEGHRPGNPPPRNPRGGGPAKPLLQQGGILPSADLRHHAAGIEHTFKRLELAEDDVDVRDVADLEQEAHLGHAVAVRHRVRRQDVRPHARPARARHRKRSCRRSSASM